MVAGNYSRVARLMNLAEREFEKGRAAPIVRKFKGMRLDSAKYDSSWDRRRGRAVRLMAVLLRLDHEELHQRVSVDAAAAEAHAEAAALFSREASILRRTASLLEVAATRLKSVVQQFHAQPAAV